MAWERRGSRKYYYRSKRVDGRVIKQYLGSSLLGEFAALYDVNQRLARRDSAQRYKRIDDTENDRERIVVAFSKKVNDLLSGALMGLGYHRHHRGEWRRQRKERKSMVKKIQVEVDDPEAIRSALVRSTKGDEKAMDGVRVLLDRVDCSYQELADTAIDSMLIACYGSNLMAIEIARRYMAEMERDLIAQSTSPLWRLLARRISICWLHLSHLETIYAQARSTLSLKQHESFEKRIERAQRRYLSAIRALAQIKKLELPEINVALPGALQVNISEVQMNVAT